VPAIYPLKGRVQHYSWGGYSYIPKLIHASHGANQPFAEYWLGAHPLFSSAIVNGNTDQSLLDFIAEDPEKALGKNIANQYKALPFLFKVLDVRQMLSIQVHPSKEEAAAGFEKENSAGIALNAPNRNYKDENHKPEQMVALCDFWLLHGFKPKEQLMALLQSVSELNFLADVFESGGYEAMYRKILGFSQAEVNSRLEPLANRILPLYENGSLQKTSEDFWAARAMKTFCASGEFDRGIFSIYLFNLVHLTKGEGIYQPAGMPHAYLEGQNIEVMANSDNVLRGGLTDKYIDTSELLKHTRFEATSPQIITPDKNGLYKTPAKEFKLYRYWFGLPPAPLKAQSAEVVFVLSGSLQLTSDSEHYLLEKGEAAFIPANTELEVGMEEGTEFYRTTVPQS